jgi:hypothetical protein
MVLVAARSHGHDDRAPTETMDAARTITPATAEGALRQIELAHAALDELAVPRTNEQGLRYTLFGRIELLRAGKLDLSRIARPAAERELRRCGACGLYALSASGDACPACGAPLALEL